ncbi:hypothetical protein CXB51_021005 [Gossypium anomalum]|uniref:DNA/RNA-binding protein Alba-like domain-containing protein n=1 Tax=Gossypium anomalum TaxID=47600 RepID=A0A8J5YNK4_9ROSI|nr:hypothetical protein CXB51_021005 [Gossypium anomalum]
MEGITEGVNNLNIMDSSASNNNNKKNRIQVSNTKKPLFFYVNLAKRYMQQYNEVELSALGMAIATVVTIAEILKNNGLAVEKKIMTSTIDMREESGGRPVQKAKVYGDTYRYACSSRILEGLICIYLLFGYALDIIISRKIRSRSDVGYHIDPIAFSRIEILLGKSEKFDELMAAAAAEDALENEEQS